MKHRLIKSYDDLESVICSDLFLITNSKALLSQEIDCNTWALSFEPNFLAHVLSDKLVDIFYRIIDNRLNQLDGNSVLFYLWFDEQANQLRFSSISNVHDSLPFAAKINSDISLKSIVDQFILINKESDIVERFDSDTIDDEDEEYTLNLFCVELKKGKCVQG